MEDLIVYYRAEYSGLIYIVFAYEYVCLMNINFNVVRVKIVCGESGSVY